MTKSTKGPITKFDVRGVTASVFANERKTKAGKSYTAHSVKVEQRYRDKDGNWQSSNYFDTDDILKAIAALQKSYDHIAIRERATKAKDQQQEAQAEQGA